MLADCSRHRQGERTSSAASLSRRATSVVGGVATDFLPQLDAKLLANGAEASAGAASLRGTHP